MAQNNLGALNIADLREMARRKMPRGLFEFIDRGAEDEVSLRNNRAAFERIKFEPRTLVDVSKRSQRVTLFGQQYNLPVVIGPTAMGALCAYRGEIMLAKAAAAAGIPYVVGIGSLTAMEKVMELGGGSLWFQLAYMWPDPKLVYELVERARVAGFKALVVTTDTQVAANREHSKRSGFNRPFRLTPHNALDILVHPGWLFSVIMPYLLHDGGMPRNENYPSGLQGKITQAPLGRGAMKLKADALNWDDIRALRKLWPHPLIIKGVLSPRDAVIAADCGVDGVVLSNHGGRALDGDVAPIEVLPRVVDAVGDRLTVLVDSGYRRGSDVVKALALGAKAVLLGRAPLYGLTAGGEAGVARALGIFREETDRVMALLGCSSVAQLDTAFLSRT